MKKRMILTIGAITAAVTMAGCDRADTDQAGSAQGGSGVETTVREDRSSTSDPADTAKAARAEPDNTGKNARDRDDATLTPEDQSGTEPDREMTRGIRRVLTASDQLSTSAKNIKIITVNGKVTLRGPVASEQEKQTIQAEAERIAGAGSVDNQLEVKPNAQEKKE